MILLKFNIKFKILKYWFLFYVKSYEKWKVLYLIVIYIILEFWIYKKNNKFLKIENFIYRIVRWFNFNLVYVKFRV